MSTGSGGIYQPGRSRFLGWIYRMFAGRGRAAEGPGAGGIHAGNVFSGGSPPRAGAGERLRLFGAGGGRRVLAPDYRPGFGWPTLALGGILATACVVGFAPKVVDRWLHGPPAVVPAHPDVLVVSNKADDAAAVRQTALPRRYGVRTVASVEAGMESLRQEPGRIGFVVIDGGMKGAGRITAAAKADCPEARVVVLSGERGMAEVSRALVDAGME